jgi:hypothetical protein
VKAIDCASGQIFVWEEDRIRGLARMGRVCKMSGFSPEDDEEVFDTEFTLGQLKEFIAALQQVAFELEVREVQEG